MPILDVTPLSYEGHWRAWPKGKKKHTFKRGEAAIEDQFKIAQLSLSQDNSRKRLGLHFELDRSGDVSGKEIPEDAAMREVRNGYECDNSFFFHDSKMARQKSVKHRRQIDEKKALLEIRDK